MGTNALSSKAIIGEFYNRLDNAQSALWVPKVSALFQSTQESISI